MGVARAVLLIVVIGTAVLVANAVGYRSQQLEVEPAPSIEVDARGAAERLAASVRFETISRQKQADFEPAPFEALHAFLAASYPRTHGALDRELVAGHSLLYHWPGADPSLAPIVLMAHQDVVPVEPGSESAWEQPPFSGAIADGFVWGRGTIDDKSSMMATLEAIELLLVRGFTPTRTIHLAFGHDEERGGPLGAAGIAALLEERGVRALFTLDEGGAVVTGLIPGVRDPIAMVAIAEKGYATLELTARAEGGHSSAPPRVTAAGALSRAVARLEANPLEAELGGPVSELLDALGRELGFGLRLALGNRWLFDPILKAFLERSPRTNALVRTTTAPTVLRAGVKENVLPSEARALVNFRIRPGDSIDGVVAHVRRVVNDPGVEVEIHRDHDVWEPSPVSSTDSEGFRVVNRTIREVFPDALVVPGLVLGGTDSKHFSNVAEDNYRFAPLQVDSDDMSRFHGSNERVAVAHHADAVRFYVRLIENAAGASSPARSP